MWQHRDLPEQSELAQQVLLPKEVRGNLHKNHDKPRQALLDIEQCGVARVVLPQLQLREGIQRVLLKVHSNDHESVVMGQSRQDRMQS